MLDLEPRADNARFVKVATVGDLTEGRVLAARLRAEGIDVRVHSEALGPYPVTVGQLAETQLWVLSGDLEDAGRVSLDAEVNSAIAPADEMHSYVEEPRSRSAWWRWPSGLYSCCSGSSASPASCDPDQSPASLIAANRSSVSFSSSLRRYLAVNGTLRNPGKIPPTRPLPGTIGIPKASKAENTGT